MLQPLQKFSGLLVDKEPEGKPTGKTSWPAPPPPRGRDFRLGSGRVRPPRGHPHLTGDGSRVVQYCGWTKSISHHLKIYGMIIPLMPANNGFSWYQSAGFCPSTVGSCEVHLRGQGDVHVAHDEGGKVKSEGTTQAFTFDVHEGSKRNPYAAPSPL